MLAALGMTKKMSLKEEHTTTPPFPHSAKQTSEISNLSCLLHFQNVHLTIHRCPPALLTYMTLLNITISLRHKVTMRRPYNSMNKHMEIVSSFKSKTMNHDHRV